MVTRPPRAGNGCGVDVARGRWCDARMKPLFLIASVLLGAAGFVQVMPDADRLAQRRPRRIAPRHAPGPAVPVPVPVGPNGQPRSNDPVRCISECDGTMRACLNRCSRENPRGCERLCFTAVAQCYAQCPGDAATMALDGGWHREDQPTGPVLHTLPRR